MRAILGRSGPPTRQLAHAALECRLNELRQHVCANEDNGCRQSGGDVVDQVLGDLISGIAVDEAERGGEPDHQEAREHDAAHWAGGGSHHVGAARLPSRLCASRPKDRPEDEPRTGRDGGENPIVHGADTSSRPAVLRS